MVPTLSETVVTAVDIIAEETGNPAAFASAQAGKMEDTHKRGLPATWVQAGLILIMPETYVIQIINRLLELVTIAQHRNGQLLQEMTMAEGIIIIVVFKEIKAQIL